MDIGEKIKELRQEKDLTQAQLAELLKIDKSTIAKYETDSREPKVYILCKIADFFAVTLDYLTGREN
ncbi:MAG: helix-turn-helix domain-containing protein [Firmicutes bacterium]|nr:helix-turn-helix domain-containing protein [Bacillota bacterium]